MFRGRFRIKKGSPMRAVIAVLPGDGIGPEVVAEATRVLQAVATKFGHEFVLRESLIGGIAIDRTGSALPADTLEMCRAADAVLLGAVGGPNWDDPRPPQEADLRRQGERPGDVAAVARGHRARGEGGVPRPGAVAHAG